MSTVRRRKRNSKHARSALGRRQLISESLESRLLLNSDWHNPAGPLDVNHDTLVTSMDALVIINDLNTKGARGLQEAGEGEAATALPHAIDVNNDGYASSSDVLEIVNYLNAEGESGVVMRYRVAALNADGTEEISTVGLGEQFRVQILVSDLRMDNREGVFAGYLDVNYDADLASIVPSFFEGETFRDGEVYGNNPQGSAATPGLIDALGSFASRFVGPGPGEFLLVEFQMTADAEGTLNLVGSPTTEPDDPGDFEQSPLLDTGLFGTNLAVCPSMAQDGCMGEMMFVNTSLQIVADIVATPDMETVEEDSTGNTIDVLSNDIVNTGTLNFESFTDVSNGTLTMNSDNTFTYDPAPNFAGDDSFTYTINNGLGTSSTTTVSITVNPVNDAPVLTVPGAATLDEDTQQQLSGTSVSDVDADEVVVSLSVNSGVITTSTSSATVTGDGSSSVSVTGSPADVNTAIGSLVYTPQADFNGQDTLSVSVSDQGNTGSGGVLTDDATISITVNPINDAPVNTVPGSQAVSNLDILQFGNGIQVTDVDAEVLEVSLTVSNGTLMLSTSDGIQASGGGTGSITAQGPIAAINAALNGMTYDPNENYIGPDTLTISSSDLGGTGAGGVLTDTDTVSITVAPPELPFAASDLFTIDEDAPAAALNLLLNDLSPEGSTVSVRQLNDQSVDAVPTQTTSGGGSLTFSGGTVTYEPADDFFGTDTFTYTIESTPDAGDGPSTGTVTINVLPINDGPVNTVPDALSVDEDNTLSFSGSNLISVQDVDAGDDGVTVTLTVGEGVLNVPATSGGTVSNNGTGAVTLDGTVTQVNDILSGLSYTPAADFFGSDSLSINTDDNGNSGSGGSLSDTDTVDITIQPINDAPVIVVPGNQSFITDFDNFLSTDTGNAISISDVDAGGNDVQLQITDGGGTLTIVDTSQLSSVTGNGTNSVTLNGTVSEINSALGAGVNYRTTSSGNVTLSAVVNDLGNTGGVPGNPNANNPLSDSADIAVEVLDFVPSNVGGYVFMDLNGDRHRDGFVLENGLEGVEITLSGTDLNGQSLPTRTVRTGADGGYTLDNLRPGRYHLEMDQLPHYQVLAPALSSPLVADDGGGATFEIGPAGGVDSVMNNFPVLGLNGLFADGFVHQTTGLPPHGELYNNLLFTIDASDPANPSTVVAYQGNWGTYNNARIVLASDHSTATVTMHDTATGSDMSITLNFLDARFRVKSFGTLSMVRVFASPDMFHANGAAPATNGAYAAAVDHLLGEAD